LATLEEPQSVGPGEALPHGEAYFALGIACPFLEDESCSIYEDRPLICREYLVVSPPERCANPRWAGVAVLAPPLPVWRAFARAASAGDHDRVEYVPLTLAPAWAEAHAEEPAARTGPEQLQALFGELTGKSIPSAGAQG
jgi:Fe-S-cluster containining protein